jgi:hypothetical protein
MVVARFLDGSMLKGMTCDFFPKKDRFHVVDNVSKETKEVRMSELKAVFFVKTYEGNQHHHDRRDVEQQGLGRRIMVTFKDGEIILGYATSYSKADPGFFVFPTDPENNNDRIFVVNTATKKVRFLYDTPVTS